MSLISQSIPNKCNWKMLWSRGWLWFDAIVSSSRNTNTDTEISLSIPSMVVSRDLVFLSQSLIFDRLSQDHPLTQLRGFFPE